MKNCLKKTLLPWFLQALLMTHYPFWIPYPVTFRVILGSSHLHPPNSANSPIYTHLPHKSNICSHKSQESSRCQTFSTNVSQIILWKKPVIDWLTLIMHHRVPMYTLFRFHRNIHVSTLSDYHWDIIPKSRKCHSTPASYRAKLKPHHADTGETSLVISPKNTESTTLNMNKQQSLPTHSNSEKTNSDTTPLSPVQFQTNKTLLNRSN